MLYLCLFAWLVPRTINSELQWILKFWKLLQNPSGVQPLLTDIVPNEKKK